ncbi:LNS2 and Lipin N domain containing protein [Trichuris trichiura]|uniref:LNS2 and Lipin N domain containing protein n=1 Tax=Trichuris trichiura TaxID=36087 RepID=A0A077YWM2_TRITR|nr:LNS2 and Lipin N domain containing protein [Trichuris trichiura]
MQSFSRMISTFRDFYNEINPATLTGAVDVLVIEQPNGSYIGSSFYVRFGKMGVLRSREKIVDISINDQLVNIYMKLSDTGEAFFLDRLTDAVGVGDASAADDLTEEEKQRVEQVRKEGAALGKVLEEAKNFKCAEHIPKKEEALKIDGMHSLIRLIGVLLAVFINFVEPSRFTFRFSEHDMRSAVSDSELEDNSSSRDFRYRRCVELSSEQLKTLPLVRGINKARFSVTTKYQGTCWCECHIFLWRWDDKLVISDIDGTITKSDVLGHILPMVGAQWTQSGVTEFFSRVVDNGYRVIYLSARAIGQSQWTKDYLRWIKQGKLGLPIGPVFLSPTSLIIALHREIIEKTPEVFKTSCLMDIRALFPENVNPFYAGVGNRHNDFIAYNAVGVPPRRIFLINPRGEVQSLVRLSSLSYQHLTDLVDHIFPPLSRSGPDNVLGPDFFEPARFSSFSYWKPRLPDISQEDEEAYESRNLKVKRPDTKAE